MNLANEIGANETLLKDISSLFSVQYSSLWNAETGKEQIKTLIVDYSFVKCTNYILGTAASSKKAAFDEWKEKLKFSMCSCEGIQSICPSLAGNFEFLLKIVKEEELLPDHLNSYTDDLIRNQDDIKSYFDNEVSFFKKLYADYLEDIEEDDILKLKTQDLIGIFKKSKTDGNAVVKKVAEEYRKSQKKTQMFELWKSKTGTKNPADWSAKHRTPILKMVDKSEYDDAKKAFETLNRTTSTEIEIEKTLEFLQNTEVYSKLSNQDLVDEAFKSLLGSYKAILTDIEKVRDALEKLAVDPYEWDTHPEVRSKIQSLAKAEYNAGGSNKVIAKINSMENEELKKYLIKQVQDNMKLGIEIINGGE